MLSCCKLEFPNKKDVVEINDIGEYNGPDDLLTLVSLEGKADTRELTLSFLGDMFPHLRKLRLNNSIIPSIRDVGCSLSNLRFLSLARCNITSLDGISTISSKIEELYLAFNQISDVCDLLGMDRLKIVDLEDNMITNLDAIGILTASPKLQALTLSGNPAANDEKYREKVAKLLPNLVYLDEKRLKPKQIRQRPPSKQEVRVTEEKQDKEQKKPLEKTDGNTKENAEQTNKEVKRSPQQKKLRKALNEDRTASSVTFPEGIANQAPRPMQRMSVQEGESASTAVAKRSGRKEVTKLDFSSLLTDEMIDKVNDRPPSAVGTRDFAEILKAKPPQQQKNNQSQSRPAKIFRPLSARGRISNN